MNKMTLSQELAWRGFENQTTFGDKEELDKQKLVFYWGVDPSAPSMQVGNLAIAMMVRVFIKHGYKPILLVGGATGLIGDPDGKAQERDLKAPEEIKKNKAAIAQQYKTVFEGFEFEIVDNYDWFKDYKYLDFLRDVGKHVPLRQMVSRDFVQSRLGEGGAGISYAEFSYSLIQGYDFMHLFENYGVSLQLSGADQWGNSIAGVDLIRRKTGKDAHVWTAPLIINSATGKKFGKTEGGAVWLDEKLTSVFKFYQFWLNVEDSGVDNYLKIYTALDKEQLEKIMKEFNKDKSSRIAQKTLAYEVTKIVHGKERADTALRVSEVLFGAGSFEELSLEDINMLKQELRLIQYNDDLLELLVDCDLASSKTEARNFIESGAISINGQKINDQNIQFNTGINLLKRGKNSFVLVKN